MPFAVASLCMHPMAQAAVLILVALGLIHGIMLWSRQVRGNRSILLMYPVLILLAFWLGWYRLSPLGFSSGRVPLLSGFMIVRPQRAAELIEPRAVLSMSAGGLIGLQPILLPGPARCVWSSTTGGAFDDSTGCDTAYTPGQGARYDVVKLHVVSACGVPPVSAEIRISLLP
jgi:hypothetical protein